MKKLLLVALISLGLVSSLSASCGSCHSCCGESYSSGWTLVYPDCDDC